jgi:hypothetical protein
MRVGVQLQAPREGGTSAGATDREAVCMSDLSALLKKCWAQERAERLSSSAAHHTLHAILDSLTGASASRGGGEKSSSAVDTGSAQGVAPKKLAVSNSGERGRSWAEAGKSGATAARPRRPPSPRARESGDI